MSNISSGSGSLSSTLLDSVNGTSSSSSTGSTSTGSTSSATDLQQTFLKLLITEMKNQDPTNPMDSSQMTSQLAQINTVSGISSLNTTLTSLASQISAGQQVSATSLIGKSVLAPGSSVSVSSGTAGSLGVNLGSAATGVTVSITDSSGKTVRTLDLGAKSSGVNTVSWDGKDDSGSKVADGSYSFSVKAVNGTDTVTATALAQSQVSSVIQQSSGTTGLVLANGSTVSLTSVAQIL